MQPLSSSIKTDLSKFEAPTRAQPTLPLDKSALRYFTLACDAVELGGLKRAGWQKKFAARLHSNVCGVCGADLSLEVGVVANILPVSLGGARKSQNDWLCCELCAKSIRNRDPLLSERFRSTDDGLKRRLAALELSQNHALPWKALKGNDASIRAYLAQRWSHPRARGCTFIGSKVGMTAFLARTHEEDYLGALRIKLRSDGIETRVNLIDKWRILSWDGLFNEYALASLIELNVLLSRVQVEGWEEPTVMVGGVQWWRTGYSISELRLREADHVKREGPALKTTSRVRIDLDSE